MYPNKVTRRACMGLCRCRTTIELAVIRDHEHDLPFEDVVPNQAATYAGDIFVALHLLQLAAQEPGGR